MVGREAELVNTGLVGVFDQVAPDYPGGMRAWLRDQINSGVWQTDVGDLVPLLLGRLIGRDLTIWAPDGRLVQHLPAGNAPSGAAWSPSLQQGAFPNGAPGVFPLLPPNPVFPQPAPAPPPP